MGPVRVKKIRRGRCLIFHKWVEPATRAGWSRQFWYKRTQRCANCGAIEVALFNIRCGKMVDVDRWVV